MLLFLGTTVAIIVVTAIKRSYYKSKNFMNINEFNDYTKGFDILFNEIMKYVNKNKK
jgi:hypothetical protein